MSVIWEDFFLSGTWPGSFSKTWADFAGFTDQGVTASITAQIDAAGNPGPSCDFTTTTAGLTGALEKWRGPSATWESWGVPAGAVVTTVQITGFDTQCYARAGVTANPTIKMRLVDATTGTTVHAAGELQSASLAETVDAAWHARTAGTARTVDSGKQASTTAVKLELELTITTTTSVNSDFGFDNVVLAITYAAPAGAGTAYSQPLADTVTITDATVRAPRKALADFQTIDDALQLGPHTNPADTVTVTDARTKAIHPRFSDAVAAADTADDGDITTAISFPRPDTFTVTDAASFSIHKAASDTATVTDSASPALSGDDSYAPADALAVTDGVALAYTLRLSDAVSVSDTPTVSSGDLRLISLNPGSLTLTPLE